ncbi:hypothetical protein ECDEC10A_2674 [Escherichia coli DEC10A]|nr:hypothetical protein ECDEC10A_2674 [Escherichia coli DEC10A]EKH39463.1 hypothetical protein ECFRIK1997_2712 [Escherichia coli FRIK1997]EKW21704.1 hypothetical protein EC950183_5480 [Escherichia coli 95.0183]ERD49123.1 hypothetical protein S1O_1726 [Escherichia coli B15]ERD52219.1 hypothetical protein S1Q_1504 [Escherichia coli B17]
MVFLQKRTKEKPNNKPNKKLDLGLLFEYRLPKSITGFDYRFR